MLVHCRRQSGPSPMVGRTPVSQWGLLVAISGDFHMATGTIDGDTGPE